jgi:hypothetical protein
LPAEISAKRTIAVSDFDVAAEALDIAGAATAASETTKILLFRFINTSSAIPPSRYIGMVPPNFTPVETV